jgi:hypothetical protein
VNLLLAAVVLALAFGFRSSDACQRLRDAVAGAFYKRPAASRLHA